MKSILLASLLLLPSLASARRVAYRMDIHDLDARRALEAQGFKVINAGSYGDSETAMDHYVLLEDAEQRDPLPYLAAVETRTSKRASKATLLEELAAIKARIDAGTASTADLSRAVSIIIKFSGLLN